MAIAATAFGDGLPLKDGRFPGPVLVFKLTESQKKVIDHYRTCQLEKADTMNVYTPYIFQLTPSQLATLKKKTGDRKSVV